MSPRSGSPKRKLTRSTSTRWPTARVGHHRLARDPERLDEEGLDAEREPERDRDDRDQLDQRAAGALLLGPRHGDRATGPSRVDSVLGLLVGVAARPAPPRRARLGGGLLGRRHSAGLAGASRLGRAAPRQRPPPGASCLGGDLGLVGLVARPRPAPPRPGAARRRRRHRALLEGLLRGPSAALAHAGAAARPGRAGSRASRAGRRRGSATSIRSILGEWTGNVRSTPTPNDCLRTVKVSRAPLPWRLSTMPSKTWVRRRVPSTTWKCTRTRSPAWKAGTRRS